jgi:hypothetical protein
VELVEEEAELGEGRVLTDRSQAWSWPEGVETGVLLGRLCAGVGVECESLSLRLGVDEVCVWAAVVVMVEERW